MTERFEFNSNKNVIEKDGKCFAHIFGDAYIVVDELNEQHETIQRLEAQLSHLEYRFTEYRNKVGKND